MGRKKKQKGALTIEASISYPIFLMIIVTLLYIMRIVYVYGLMQHAVSQTAKEMSMYAYLYQVAGINDLNQQIAGATGARTRQLNEDMGEVIQFYEDFSSGDLNASYNGTTDLKEILKNIGAAILGEAGKELDQQLFEAVARPLIESYIGADSKGNSADARLKALRVIDGINGLNLNSSSFYEDGATIDLIVCYSIDPILPIDIMPELNLANRAYIRGMNGTSVFKESDQKKEEQEKEQEKKQSVWDQTSDNDRGKAIQKQEKVRNLPDRFPAFSAYDPKTGQATAEVSIDLQDISYQKASGIKRIIRTKCNKMNAFKDTTYAGVTLKKEEIKSKKLIIYIPSSTNGREIDRTLFDQTLKEMQAQYPDIQIVAKEID